MSGSVPGFALSAEGGERLSFAGGNFVIRASAETTGGAFSIVEEALGAAEQASTLGPEAYATASEKYGITWVG
jgi:hypothetical protein